MACTVVFTSQKLPGISFMMHLCTLHAFGLDYKCFPSRTAYEKKNIIIQYYEKKLENAKSNTTWKILNEVINKNRRTKKLPSEFNVDGQNISNPILVETCQKKFLLPPILTVLLS